MSTICPLLKDAGRVVNDVLEKLIQNAGDCGVRYVTAPAGLVKLGRDAERGGG